MLRFIAETEVQALGITVVLNKYFNLREIFINFEIYGELDL